MALILAREVAVMFLFIAIGVLIKRKGIIDTENARALSNVLLLVIVPSIVVRNLQAEYNPALLPTMGVTALATIAMHALFIFLTSRLVRDPGDGTTTWRVSRLAAVFANAGFMGFPLLSATVGQTGLLYGVIFIGIFNIVTWIYCVPTLTGKRGLSFKQLLTNPATLAFILGLIMHFTGIRLGGVLYSVVNQLADMNTPVSLIIIGVFLASINVREAATDLRVYRSLLIRNILYPLCVLLLLWGSRVAVLLPGGRLCVLSLVIMASCPSAVTTILMSARYHCDSQHGAKLVATSTAFSIITLPLMVTFANFLLQY